MKTKLVLLFSFICLSIAEAVAGPVIIMQGGGRTGRFDYIEARNTTLICRGCGVLVCPIKWGNIQERGTTIQLSEVADQVSRLVEAGERNGELQFRDVLPVKWSAVEDGFQMELITDEPINYENQ